MEKLAPPIAHDHTAGDERRGSWAGDFDPARRTSFANAFLEIPPDYESKTRTSIGQLHYVPLEEEPDLMATPPISPVASRHQRNISSYFDSPTQSKPLPGNGGNRRSLERETEPPGSIFSNLLTKAFETVSSSGEALDVHGKDVHDLAIARRSAKGKGRAIAYDEDDEPLPASPMRVRRPTSVRSQSVVDNQEAAPGHSTTDDDAYYRTHTFEASLVNTLEMAEKKASKLWDWLVGEGPEATPSNVPRDKQ